MTNSDLTHAPPHCKNCGEPMRPVAMGLYVDGAKVEYDGGAWYCKCHPSDVFFDVALPKGEYTVVYEVKVD